MASNADDEKPQSKKLFVNCVDSYQGKNIAKYLSQCVVGASLEEIEEDEDDNESVDSGAPPAQKEGCYELVGTLKDKAQSKPEFVKEIIDYETKEQLYENLVECDVIIYDVTEDPDQIDEAVWAISELHSDIDKLERPKMFILVSSVMTWARSKPLDPDDPEIPFTEDDYRRRRPHPNFKEHISAEKTVIKLGKTNKNKLVTYVVASGLTYGCGESIFHYLFKAAWHNAPELQCFGQGQNVVPMIHVRDLAAVLQNIADSRPKVRYLVAVDDSKNTLEEVVKACSSSLTTGKVKKITKEEALLSKDIEQADFDMLLVNLRMDAVFVKENMRIRWAAETGLPENITTIVKEYKDARGLQPMRAFVMGPPASGKTTIVKQLCDHYKLHHIKIKDVIDEAMEKLSVSAARADAEDQEDDDGKAQEDADLLETINEGKEGNKGRIEDQYIIRFFKNKLHSMPCQNQGFILDGFPKTLEQAKDLFAADDDEAEEEDGKGKYDRSIMPEQVVCLEAPDDFLKLRIMDLPESAVSGTHNTESGLLGRLAEYRAVNTEDETVLNFFDEIEIHPEKIDVTKDQSPHMQMTVEKIKKLMGEPRNYGVTFEPNVKGTDVSSLVVFRPPTDRWQDQMRERGSQITQYCEVIQTVHTLVGAVRFLHNFGSSGPTPEELEEMRRMAHELKLKQEAEERAERERREAEEAAERKRRQEEWSARLEEVKREEYEQLETKSIPLRNYLMKHVMPTLTQGLIDACKVRPDDAIDFLAEYLFQHNPQTE